MLNHTVPTIITTTTIGSMTGAIVRAVGKNADLNDILNDSCVRVMEQIESFDAARGNFSNFCCKIAGNTARNHMKAEGYRSHDVVTASDDEGENGGEMIVESLPGADGRVEVARSMEAQDLALAISEIQDETDRAFVRALIRGESIGDAGKAFGWNAVKATRKRAALLAALKAAVSGEDGDEDGDE
jgi:DNA-directed RNA polymerase specialized sigma24 family protein